MLAGQEAFDLHSKDTVNDSTYLLLSNLSVEALRKANLIKALAVNLHLARPDKDPGTFVSCCVTLAPSCTVLSCPDKDPGLFCAPLRKSFLPTVCVMHSASRIKTKGPLKGTAQHIAWRIELPVSLPVSQTNGWLVSRDATHFLQSCRPSTVFGDASCHDHGHQTESGSLSQRLRLLSSKTQVCWPHNCRTAQHLCACQLYQVLQSML